MSNLTIGLITIGLITLGAFLVGRKLKAVGSELAAKLQELKNKNYARIYQEQDWMPGVYRFYKEGAFTQLVVCDSTQTIFYTYDEDGNQVGVNYENHTPFFHNKLPGEPPAGA